MDNYIRTKTESIITIILLAVIAFGVFFIADNSKPLEPKMGTVMIDTPIVIEGPSNTSTTTKGTSVTLLLAANTERIGATICHKSTTSTGQLYLSLVSATSSLAATTTVQAGEGYRLNDGECFSMPRDTGYISVGAIFGLATSTSNRNVTSTVSLMEK